MVVKVTKISQNVKNKSFLSIEKKYYRTKKTLYYNYNKYFNHENFVSLQGKYKKILIFVHGKLVPEI